MVHWLCRWSNDGQPPTQQAEQARQLGISGWLFELAWHPSQPLRVPEALRWLAQQPAPPLGYGLQWRLTAPTSPAQEQAAAAALAGWLQPAAAQQPLDRPLLVLAGLERLSHPRFAMERLRLALRRELGAAAAPVLLLGLTSGHSCSAAVANLDGQLEADAGADHTQRLGGCCNYESHLARAHWQRPQQPPRQPVVLGLSASAEAGYVNGSAEVYGAWLAQSNAWSRLMAQGSAVPAWLLLESWEGHQRWWPELQTAQPSPAQAPAPATPRAERPVLAERWGEPDGQQPALLVHGFHLEVLEPLLARLPQELRQRATLYLSTPAAQVPAAAALLHQQGWQRAEIHGCQNRGRDMAPFLEALLPAALAAGHPWALKLHSKRSSHLGDGNAWSQTLIATLTSETTLEAMEQRFQEDPQLGLLAPACCLLPVGLHLDQNGPWLERLTAERGWTPAWLLAQRFAAGSMYAFRPQALAPLLDWQPAPEAFAAEAGQADGTLAHALERLVGAACAQAGFRLEELAGTGAGVPGFGRRQALPWSEPGHARSA